MFFVFAVFCFAVIGVCALLAVQELFKKDIVRAFGAGLMGCLFGVLLLMVWIISNA